MPRTLPRTKFHDGQAAGWVFGVSSAFKAALDISPTSKVLSSRGDLKAELDREGVHVLPGVMDGEPKAIADLYAAMKAAGLVVIDLQVESNGEKKKVLAVIETEGNPPAYKFSIGDIFYDPPQVHKMDWKEGLKVLRRSIQISMVEKDQITATLRTYQDEVALSPASFSCSQAQLAALLRTGAMEAVQVPLP